LITSAFFSVSVFDLPTRRRSMSAAVRNIKGKRRGLPAVNGLSDEKKGG
jgi:hypothetical protein